MVNNFYADCNREIMEVLDIKRYRNDLQILLTTNTTEIYQYSDVIFEDMIKDTFKIYEMFLLYSQRKVTLPANNDRRLQSSNTTANRPDKNLTK